MQGNFRKPNLLSCHFLQTLWPWPLQLQNRSVRIRIWWTRTVLPVQVWETRNTLYTLGPPLLHRICSRAPLARTARTPWGGPALEPSRYLHHHFCWRDPSFFSMTQWTQRDPTRSARNPEFGIKNRKFFIWFLVYELSVLTGTCWQEVYRPEEWLSVWIWGHEVQDQIS